jgi:hypothetical protein
MIGSNVKKHSLEGLTNDRMVLVQAMSKNKKKKSQVNMWEWKLLWLEGSPHHEWDEADDYDDDDNNNNNNNGHKLVQHYEQLRRD